MTMNKITRRTFGLTSAGLVAGAGLTLRMGGRAFAASGVPESSKPIVMAMLEWTGQHITTKIAGNILQKMGYTVKYVTSGSYPSAVSLSDGELSAVLELWSNNLGQYYPKLIKEKKVVNAGDLGLDAREGWLYPKYMEEKCPGLPAWDAMVKCHQDFATPDTFPDGRLLAYPADWGHRSADIIKETGIPFQAVPAGSEGALVAELKSAVARKAPLLMMFWSPHWVLSTVKYGWIDMPKDIAKKYALQSIPVWKMVSPGFEKTWPAAFRFLQHYQIHNKEQQVMMNLVDNQGKDLDKVTTAWVDNNKDVWKPWVDAALAGT